MEEVIGVLSLELGNLAVHEESYSENFAIFCMVVFKMYFLYSWIMDNNIVDKELSSVIDETETNMTLLLLLKIVW